MVRCINILDPFYPVNRKIVTLSTSVNLVVWTAIATLNVWSYSTMVGLKNKVDLIKSMILQAKPGFSISSLTGSKVAILTSLSQGQIVLVQFLTPIAIPALLCFVLMIVQIVHLNKKQIVGRPEQNPAATNKEVPGKIKNKKRVKQSSNQKAATTILIVTTIYVLTSIISVGVGWNVCLLENMLVSNIEKQRKSCCCCCCIVGGSGGL